MVEHSVEDLLCELYSIGRPTVLLDFIDYVLDDV